ncbi:MAG: hypothetical protein L0Z50_04885, partial [Verrucomicrobiales bacterium]|nr:hypothetical protein [Verrucomicrobiales bacterium]
QVAQRMVMLAQKSSNLCVAQLRPHWGSAQYFRQHHAHKIHGMAALKVGQLFQFVLGGTKVHNAYS